MTVRDRQAIDRAIERLRKSEYRFQLFVNGVQDCAIYMLDAQGRVSSWNAGAARIKGWNAEEVIGQSFEVFFTTDDREAGLPARLLAAAAKAGSRQTSGWRIRKDGSRFYSEGSLTVLRDGQGEVEGFAKITRDLTERLRAEENERRLIAEKVAREVAQGAEERLARLQRITAALSQAASPDDVAAALLRECADAMGAAATAVYVLAPDGKSLELFAQQGHDEEVLEPYRSIPIDARTPLTDVARERAAAFYESFDAWAERYPALRDPSRASHLQASAALPLVAHGDLLGVMGVRFVDRRPFDAGERTLLLTVAGVCAQAIDRAKLFAAETEARAAAEAASRAKDEFLAMLGHELRNPLAPISTAIQLMKLRGDRSQRARDIIERQVSHLNTLVDDLLDVSRVARGLISLSRACIEVSEILSRAIEMASPLLEQRRQHLAVAAPTSGLSIDADPLRMAQVVSNLLTNAAKYTPPGGHVWLSAELEGGEAVIRVRDDGEGIGPDLLPRVFDLFVQGHRTIARSEGGLGLGLALVKNLVALHGGTVAVTSEGPGRGSEFVVRVPALPLGTRAAEPAAPPVPIAGHAAKRILVVDDNEDARELLGEMLREIGHHVELAADGPSALDKLKMFPADVAILDLGLPVMDGFELARRIAETPAGPQPRLVALTGYGGEGDVARTRAVGFDAHLVKPVNLASLVSAIDRGRSREGLSTQFAG
jgi:PAS domain S-box-containing protein